MKSIELNGASIFILPVIKGLVSEEKVVEDVFVEITPDLVCISISPEELDGLRDRKNYDSYEPSELEVVYGNILSTFGEVRLPPPCYVKTLELCEKNGVPIKAIDMPEEQFTETYCNCVSAFDLIRESFMARRISRKRFDISSPYSFVLEWDRKVNAPRGFRKLSEIKEKHMAESIASMTLTFRNILAVLEYERAGGTTTLLEKMSADRIRSLSP
ncbi:MAG: hypothetical protein QXN93_03725 [Methanomassiliicoccales archaeon]